MRYICDDGNAPITIEADTAREAAQDYVDTGDWGHVDKTTWINVYVEEDLGEDERGGSACVKIAIDPEEPDCEDGEEHDWQSPFEVLGGLEENPGVWGHGGGVIINRVCSRCGKYKRTDTWAQDMEDGTQGLESVEYEDADEESSAWVAKQHEEEDFDETDGTEEEDDGVDWDEEED